LEVVGALDGASVVGALNGASDVGALDGASGVGALDGASVGSMVGACGACDGGFVGEALRGGAPNPALVVLAFVVAFLMLSGISLAQQAPMLVR